MKKEEKVFRVLKILSIICIIIIGIELFYMWFTNFKFEQKNIFYDSYNSIVLAKDKVVLTGASQFRNSKFNEWQRGYEKGKIAIYNSDLKVISEKQYKKGFNSVSFYTLPLDKGYVTVGALEYNKKQNKEHIKDAVITRYDQNLKVIWEKYFQELGDSKFLKVIYDEGNFIVIGQSIYQNMEIGNHNTGGGVIIKYDENGKIIWKNNYGGNKSGIFNDIIRVKDGYIVVGKDSIDTGIIIKYDLNGKIVWNKNYSYTDKKGFMGITSYNDELLVIGSKKIKDNNYQALIVKYDLFGNKKEEYLFGNTKTNELFNSIIVDNDNFVLVGQINKELPKKDPKEDPKYTSNSFIAKYDKNFKLIFNNTYKGNNEDYFMSLVKFNNNYLVAGYSNSKDKKLKTNGKDYKGILVKYSLKGKIKEV